LLAGDYRLGWLRSAQDGGLDEDKLEPPVPAGLEELSGPLHALIEFLEIDEGLLEVAAQASKPLATGASRRELCTWIRRLPEKDKTELLITAAVNRDERWPKRPSAAFSTYEPAADFRRGRCERTV
jgi:hypothetical protein